MKSMLLIMMMFIKSNALQDYYFQFKGPSKTTKKKKHKNPQSTVNLS